jgi:hypothetical protein
VRRSGGQARAGSVRPTWHAISKAPVYASNEEPAPESDFVAAELRHLVVGNRGRLLDARRTPVTLTDVSTERGSFVVRVDAFEDTGAHWELGFEEIDRFQFPRSAARVSSRALAQLRDSAARFDRDLSIECDKDARDDTLRHLRQRRDRARAWLAARASGPNVDAVEQIAKREGHPTAYALLDEFLAEHELDHLERDFTTSFVTNPRSGEIVKGHAIVLAELGLCPYRGKAPRDPDLLAGRRSRPRRAEHLLWRLAFTHELFAMVGATTVTLYRAAATDGVLLPRLPSSLVSATFSRDVAEAHFEGGPTTRAAVLWRQVIPTDRVLMSFLETKAMNERFHEAEAILLADPSNDAF